MIAGDAGGMEMQTKGFSLVLSFSATDQLYLTHVSGSQCTNSVTGTTQEMFNVLGGTGRFQGATGSISSTATVTGLAQSALAPSGFLAAIGGTFDGTITLTSGRPSFPGI